MVAGGLLGSPLARWLIERNKLVVKAEAAGSLKAFEEVVHTPAAALDAATLLRLLTCIVVIMVLGFWLGSSLQQHLGIVLPSYVGAMFVAIILRNLNDRAQVIEVPGHAVSTIGDVCLGMFLTMAMMSLKFWELEKLGAVIKPISLPNMQHAIPAYYVIAPAGR